MLKMLFVIGLVFFFLMVLVELFPTLIKPRWKTILYQSVKGFVVLVLALGIVSFVAYLFSL